MSKELLIRSESDNLFIKGQKFSRFQEKEVIISEVKEESTGILEFSISSDRPYERWWGTEILRHGEQNVNLERLNNAANILYNHDRDRYLAVCLKAWLVNSKKLRVRTKWNLNNPDYIFPRAIYQDIGEEILKNSSVGYSIDELLFKEVNGKEVGEAVKWTPFEGSIVTVPADHTVGVERQRELSRKYYDLGKRTQEEQPENPRPISVEDLKLTQQKPSATEATESTPDTQEKSSGSGEAEENSPERELSNVEDNNKELPLMVDTPTVEDKQNERQLERDRIRNLQAAGKRWNCPELAEKAIDNSWSEQDLFREIAKRQDQDIPQEPVAGVVPVGMSKKERREYSVMRAVGYASGHLKAEDCGLELEVSREIQKRNGGKSTKGIYIDQSELVAYRAPYETGVPAAAGNLIETELLSERFIDQLVNESAFMGMGVTYLRDLTGNVEIPRESSYTTGFWVGEKQTIPEDEGTFDKIAMSPKKLAVLTKYTYEMIEQGSIDLEIYARRRLLRGLALELDRTIGFGSGIGNEPLGIASHPEVKSIVLGANGGALSWESLIAMQSELYSNNAMGDMGYVLNARTKAKLQTTLDQTTGSGNWLWQTQTQGDGTIAGYRARCSNQIPNNLSKGTANDLTAIFFGDFSNVLIGMWSGMEILANPYSEFSEAIIQVRAMQLLDMQLTRGDYFCVATDVQNNQN